MTASPVFILSFFALAALLQGVSKRFGNLYAVAVSLYLGLGGALAGTAYNLVNDLGGNFLTGSYSFEHLGGFGQVLILALALVTSILFQVTYQRTHFFRGEIISIFLMTVLGMIVMVSTNELITLFVGLELASIGLYALIGYIDPSRLSVEGAVKYLVLGSFASAFMLFGFALLYAATGSMVIQDIIRGIGVAGAHHPWVELGGMLTMVGLGFKLALAPFHMWAPDAYEAAPTGLTAFMATAVKVMVVVVMLRFLGDGMQTMVGVWGVFFMFAATASAIIGNMMALVQSSLKRMLAYSSVAHAGYMAIALCAIHGETRVLAASSVLFYLVVYSIVSMAAFGVIMWLETPERNNIQIDDLSGLATRHPWAAFALTASMFTFAGIPPTSGFMGKLFLFNAALLQGLYGLVVVGIIGAVIAVYYYLRVIVRVYMSSERKEVAPFIPEKSFAITLIVAVCLGLTILLGTVLPNRMMFLLKSVPKAVMQTTSTH